jgi:glucose-6-phosphate 1-epimerase
MNGIFTPVELDRQLGIPGVAKVSEGNGGLARVQITGAFGEGEIYLHGAHVTSWKPASHEEVLFVSTKSRWEEGQAIRGGIPICFPWFRAKQDNPHAPAHGLVRTKTWQLESMIETENGENENGVAVTMFTQSDEHTRKWWPGEFRLVHRVTFGSELRLELVCMNTGTTPFRFEEALHTYNRIANIEDARLQGLDGVSYLDNIESNKEKTQRGDVIIASPTDNAYGNTQNQVDLLDANKKRRIRLRKEHSLTTVVWNPWSEGAARLQDLGDGEWNQFLCVEASNILDAAIHLAPGEEHRMAAILNVESLGDPVRQQRDEVGYR